MGKIFNDLAYSNYVPTYAGLPIAEADETAGVLEDRYYANKDVHDKLEIAISNIDINTEDGAIKADALQKLQESMNGTVLRGDYENASMRVRNEAKSFATNQGVMAAVKSAAGKKSQLAAMKAKVGLDEEDNGILQEDYDLEEKKANANSKGVYYDEASQSWKGHWSMGEVPKYINMGKRTDEFLDGFKADTYLGRELTEDGKSRVMMKKDGKWQWAEEQQTVDGSYIYQPSTEEVPYEQVYQAARQHLMQAGDVKERMKYDAAKNTATYDDYVAQDPNFKKAMMHDLQNITGFTAKDLQGRDNEEIFELWKQENVVYSAISGAVAKHSYVKETAKTFGMPWWAKQKAANSSKASATGGTGYNTVKSNRILHEAYTQGYGQPGVKNIGEYNIAKAAAETEANTHRIALEHKRAEIERAKFVGQPTGALETQAEAIQQKYNQYQQTVTDLDTWKNYTLDKLKDEFGEDVIEKTIEARDKVYKEGYKTVYGGESTGEQMKQAAVLRDRLEKFASGFGAIDVDAMQGQGTFAPTGLRDWRDNVLNHYDEKSGYAGLATGLDFILDDSSNSGKNQSPIGAMYRSTLNELEKSGKLTDDVKVELEAEFNSLLQDLGAAQNEWRFDANGNGTMPNRNLRYFHESNEGKALAAVDKKMNEIAENRTYTYTTVNLSTSPTGATNSTTKLNDVSGRSEYTKIMTNHIRTNPSNYNVVGQDGKIEPFNMNKNQYDPLNTIVSGMTEEYLPGIGYCLVAQEWQLNDKNKPEGVPREILLQPSAAAKRGAMQEAIREVQTGTFANDKGRIGGKTTFDVESSNIMAKIWEQDIVDGQMAEFKKYPLDRPSEDDIKNGITTKTIERTVFLGKYEMKVNRNTDYAGNTTWDVLYQDKETGETRLESSYSSENDVQLEMEQLMSDDGGAFYVPLAGLEKVFDANNKLKLDYADTGSPKASAPYLHANFISAMQDLENQMKLPYKVNSFLRTKYANERLGVNANNPHVNGNGMDIDGNGPKGKKVLAWLEAHSTNGSIDGTNLRYAAIKSTGGEITIQISGK